MIEVQNLIKRYGEHLAVNDISFEVKKGEIVGFLGQNGAGKSTTMKILTCFMPATSGLVRVAGYDVFEDPMEVKRRMGYLPENPPVYVELLVSEYLSFVAGLRSIPKPERKKKIDRVIEKCNLGDVRHRLIGNLSKGYRQRVGIAQALLHEPEVLILDEPTIGLDPKQVSQIRELICSMRGEHTLVYSTHILSEVAATCDRILIIDRGKIVAQEAVESIGAEGKTRVELVVQQMAEGLLDAVKGVSGVTHAESFCNGTNRIVVESDAADDVMAQLSKAVVTKGAGLIRMARVQRSLEDYYLGLIGGTNRERAQSLEQTERSHS